MGLKKARRITIHEERRVVFEYAAGLSAWPSAKFPNQTRHDGTLSSQEL